MNFLYRHCSLECEFTAKVNQSVDTSYHPMAKGTNPEKTFRPINLTTPTCHPTQPNQSFLLQSPTSTLSFLFKSLWLVARTKPGGVFNRANT